MLVHALAHVGLCVSDLERSLRFYQEVFGFKEVSARPRLAMEGEPAATLVGLPNVSLQAVYLERDGTTLELLAYPRPGSVAGDTPRPMNRQGLTHLSFAVDDPDAVAQRAVAAGGRLLEDTHIGVALFVLDPDDTRIELVRS